MINASAGHTLKNIMELHMLQTTFTSDDEPDVTWDSGDVVSCDTLVETGLLGINRQLTDWRLSNITTLHM